MTSPIERLLSATRDAVRYAALSAASDCPETAILDDLLGQPFPPGASPVGPAHTPVVSDYLDAAVEAATTPRERALARAVAAASPHLRWIAPYQPGEGSDELADGYASAMLSMPGPPPRDGYQAPYATPNVLVAFTLQAPTLPIRCIVTRRRRSTTSFRGPRNGSETVSRGVAVFPASGSSTQANRATRCAPQASPCWPWPRGSTTWIARPRCWRWTGRVEVQRRPEFVSRASSNGSALPVIGPSPANFGPTGFPTSRESAASCRGRRLGERANGYRVVSSPSSAAHAARSRSGENRSRRASPWARTASRNPGSVSARWSRARSAPVSPGG